MSPLFELLLDEPLPGTLRQVLLFSGFYFHLLFVLLALGTALIAVSIFSEAYIRKRPDELRWDKKILRNFLSVKSLAVVLGVAPLLLIQVGHTLPFFSATGLFASFWMLIIALLIVSFISFDGLAHRISVHPGLHLVVGFIALFLLFSVPGIFTAILVAAEVPARWVDMLHRGGWLPNGLIFHWLLRYLHILAAAVVFGAAFHYFFTAGSAAEKKAKMRAWLLGGILAQLVVGPLLLVSLPRKMNLGGIVFLGAGLSAAAILTGIAGQSGEEKRPLKLKTMLSVLLVLLLFMLLVRQDQQDMAFAGIERLAKARSLDRAAVLEPYRQDALARYRENMALTYDDGYSIYTRSCAFCHAINGSGQGTDAKALAIPPEDISQVRAARSYLMNILASGVEGTGMPYFSVFIRTKLEGVIDYLDETWSVVGLPPGIDGIPPSDLEEARQIYGQRCSGCHGSDGRPTAAARKFKPPPPNFAEYSLLPQRAFDVMSHGYHGTMMGNFASGLSPEMKKALAQVLYDLRSGT